ncbi:MULTISPECIES: nitroreductase [Comamonas]|jgi:nitroreductase|uniref:nitroreductase n=1 Tax=Comamonas TaxID=283 RepID=UPI001C45015D|nr:MULTISPECIES: nitroreductase [Comamonas]MBV7418251.1 nitroreductase [Comamonas sp. CMM03]MDH1290644.1 nitroreductase [Comamonas terrigena]MDH1700898.1 nitroreductase [Comamonas terrigena]MDI9855788.1 nitroreductase [Comamonas sp. 17RB]
MDVTQALRERRSVRAFTEQVPAADLVQRIMQDAAAAASGGNMQPWRVAAISGQPLQAMLADVAKTPGEENPQHVSYPPNLWEPYRTRRFANGEDLYASIGVPREDKAGRLKQLAKNAQFFGAPVGVIMFTEERMGPVQWIDLGIYLQAFMLRATEEGLATCAQGFWRRYDAVVKQHLAVPEGYLVAFGIALGYEDTTAPINTMRATRAEFAEWGQLQGF